MEEFRVVSGLSPGALGTIMVGYCHAKAGRLDEANAILDEVLVRSTREYVPPGGIALLYDAIGNRNKSFEWLDKALEERSGVFMFVKVDPLFDSFRSDPRFDALLEKAGLTP
jgi:hypothetical protein